MFNKNFILIEEQITSTSLKDSNLNYYNFIKEYEQEIKEFVLIFISQKNHINKYFNNVILIIKDLKLIFNEDIKNEFEYVVTIIAIFTIKSFFNSKPKELDDGKHIIFESNQIINQILIDFKSFMVWIEIFYSKKEKSNELFNVPTSTYKKGILYFLNILTIQNLILVSKITYKNKSYIFYRFLLKNKNFIFLDLFFKKFKIFKKKDIKIYFYIDHYTNVFEILKKNIESKLTIKLNTENDFLKNILDVKVKIDYELLEYYFDNKLKKLNLEKNKLYEEYNLIINNLKRSIQEENIKEISLISKELSEISNILRISEILKNKKDCFFYFPISICFRGRIHFLSSISFTFYKEFRYCLHGGEYERDFVQPFHVLNEKIEKIFLEHIRYLKYLKKYKFEDKPLDIKISILWILISIAEIFKTKLGSEVTINRFLECGIKVINEEIDYKSLNELDEFDDLKLQGLKKILDEINKNVYIKRFLSKDATASCFQHLIKILGNSDQEAVKWCNLKSENSWYDTYTFILNKWFTTISIDKLDVDCQNLLKTYFYRSSIKKPIMTLQYGAKDITCFKYFCQINNLRKKNEETIKFIENYYNNFQQFINNSLGLLDSNPKNIIIMLDKINHKINLIDGSEVNLIYFKMKKHQIKVTINNLRYTKQEWYITTIKNLRRTNSTSRANYIHTHDAATSRYVLTKKAILTIHDCFLIDYRSTTYLIAVINEAMGITFHDLNLNKKLTSYEIFSIFIII